jgi:prepilin-type N-terminal cleavage/methylation domain-containing protein
MKTHMRHWQRGFSVAEMMVVTAILAIILTIILSMIEEATRLSLFIESRNELAAMAQRPVNQIQREVLQSVAMFGEDAVGTPYRQMAHDALAPTDPQPVPVSLLPQIAAGAMGPDTAGTRDTGNALMLVRKIGPVAIAIPAATGAAGGPEDPANFPAVTFFADRFVFHYYYLSNVRTGTNLFRLHPNLQNLIRFRSVPYADYFQLANATSNLSPLQRRNLSTQLQNATNDLQIAWNPGQPFDSSFYEIDANLLFPVGGTSPYAQPALERRDVVAMIPELLGGRIAGKMPMTIAYRENDQLLDPFYINPNEVPAGIGIDGRGLVPVPRFGNLNDLQDCGFEVKIVGPAGSRQVMTRLVMYSNYAVTKMDAQEGIVISSFTR